MEDGIRTTTADGESLLTAENNEASTAGQTRPLCAVSDEDLIRRLTEILVQSRRVEEDLIAHIAEVDARRLYAREAFPSMFAYCTDALHLSEGEAYLRIAVARASRGHPVLLEMLGDGRLHLSGIALIAPHLTPENRDTLLRRATHRTKRQIEELIAELAPQPDVPALIRRLPERTASPAASTSSGMGTSVTRDPLRGPEAPQEPGCLSIAAEETLASTSPVEFAAPAPPVPAPIVQPLAPGRYKVQFTASAALREKLERLQALMRSQIPGGDLSDVIEAAVTEKLERLEARRFASTSRPRTSLGKTDTSPRSRYIPAAVRRAVRERDGNRCRYVDASGRRCEERHRLEYHHVHTFGVGGGHDPENLRLMCAMHNDYLAECDYGRQAIPRFRRPRNDRATTRAPVRVGSAASQLPGVVSDS